MIDPTDSLSIIKGIETYGHLSEVYEITTFRGFRMNAQGENAEVTVEIGDSGTPGDYRFIVRATDEQRHRSGGTNGGASLDEALGTVHWDDLDRDEN